MDPEEQLYVVEPAPPVGKSAATGKSDAYRKLLRERTFLREYRREHGKPWLSAVGRPKPQRHIWQATAPGALLSPAELRSTWSGFQ